VVESCESPMESSSEIVLLVVVLKVYKYVTKIFWAELTFFARIKFPILCSAKIRVE